MHRVGVLRGVLRVMMNEPAIRHESSFGPLNTIKYVRETLQKHVIALRDMPQQKVEQAQLAGHTMSASRDRAVIPLASEPGLRLQYINYRRLVRFGMLLEDLDTFAVWLAYRHNQGGETPMGQPRHHPMIIVTACVDAIQLNEDHKITPDSDIYMDGYVSWVGRSSCEATMQLSQMLEGKPKNFLSAKFVLASREPDGQKGIANHPLRTTNPDEEQIVRQGEERCKQLRLTKERSLLKTLPTESERKILHEVFLKTVDQKSLQRRILPENNVWLEDAKLNNTIICFPIQRNLYKKIFGGFLMRQAFELAWANAALFSRGLPKVVAVDDIMFRKSVEVGSLLLLSSQVCYTIGRFMELMVTADVVDISTGERETTNTFYFTLQSEGDVPTVLPNSYADGMLYLNAKRRFESEGQFL